MTKLLWTQKQDIGPAPRIASKMAHDAAHSRTVLFGSTADGATFFNDTWEWDGENWTQSADTGPAGRFMHAMAFDTARGRVVLFGEIPGEW